jgi:hypothetical protein
MILQVRVFLWNLGQEGMHPMKPEWREKKDGFVWTFAINSR